MAHQDGFSSGVEDSSDGSECGGFGDESGHVVGCSKVGQRFCHNRGEGLKEVVEVDLLLQRKVGGSLISCRGL